MPSPRSCCLIFASLVAAGPVSAQLPAPGTIVVSMQMKLPDSVKTPMPIGGNIDVQISVMNDGHRVAMDIAPGPGMTMPMLQGVRLHVLYTPGIDTIHTGILLPAAMAPPGGAAGYRLDVPLTALDSIRRKATEALDSAGKKLADSMTALMSLVTYRSMGSTSTVAGLSCEEWETITVTDTTRLCVIPTPAPMLALQNYVKRTMGVQQLMDRMPGIGDAAKRAFGGRDMTSIRTVNMKTGMVVELKSYTSGVPDAALLDLPPNLQPLPGGLGIKPPGGSLLERQ